MFAAFAASASASTFAPASVGSRRLIIEAKPSFLISGTASGFVAPPQATVVSSRAKLVAPGTSCLVTCCAPADRDPKIVIATRMSERRRTMVTPLEKERSSSYESRRLRHHLRNRSVRRLVQTRTARPHTRQIGTIQYP